MKSLRFLDSIHVEKNRVIPVVSEDRSINSWLRSHEYPRKRFNAH